MSVSNIGYAESAGVHFIKPSQPVPDSTGQAMSTVVGILDPGHNHLRPFSGNSDGTQLPDTDPALHGLDAVYADSFWTTDGKEPTENAEWTGKPRGMLSLEFGSTEDAFGRSVGPVAFELPCGLNVAQAMDAVGDTSHPPHWSPCDVRNLPGGVEIKTTSAKVGASTVDVVIKTTPGAGLVALTAVDSAGLHTGPTGVGRGPLLTSSPWTLASLTAAVSPSAVKGLAPASRQTTEPSGFLRAADLGSGWRFSPDHSGGSADSLQPPNGCSNMTLPLTKTSHNTDYSGTDLHGDTVTVDESVYALNTGQGPSAMSALRALGTGGCPQDGPVTVSNLPSGVGDDAFLERYHALGQMVVWIRSGDSVLMLSISLDHGAAPTVSTADQAWLTQVGKHAVARLAAATP
jgi:hypothetical protein